MPRLVTAEQFHDALPGYVGLAHAYTAGIIDRALSEPGSNVQVRARVHNSSIPPDYKEHIVELGRIAELRDRNDSALRSVEVDVPMDGVRLALEDHSPLVSRLGRQVRAWLYAPPMTLTLPSNETRSQTEANNDRAKPDKSGTDWIGGDARSYLGNLVVPGYIFEAGTDDPNEIPAMLTYVYSSGDVLAGKHTFSQASGIGNVQAGTYQRAVAPPYIESDAGLLEGHNLETYHTAKIETILAIMRVASGGV